MTSRSPLSLGHFLSIILVSLVFGVVIKSAYGNLEGLVVFLAGIGILTSVSLILRRRSPPNQREESP